MAKAKNTTQMGKEHEEYIVSVFERDNARRSRSSGGSFHDPVDITSDNLVIEAESTENQSYSLKLDFWREVQQKVHTGKLPALAVRFRDAENGNHSDLAVIDLHDLAMMVEELEQYRSDAIR